MDIDTLGVGKALELFPKQIKEAWKKAYSTNLPKFSPDAVVISGMGGSSNAAKIIESVYEEDFKVPLDIDIHNDYGLPSWVNKNSLVIANSYSGNTEETLSSVASAQIVSANIIGVTTGGKLGQMIKDKKIYGVVVDPGLTNPTGFPKTGLGVSFGALAAVLSKTGIIALTEKELFTALDEIETLKLSAAAKPIAEWTLDAIPVLFGGRPLIGSLNAGRNAICEIGRTFTLFFDFPEVNHVLIEATQMPSAAKEKLKYIFFVSKFNHDRVLTRYKITAQIFGEQKLNFMHYTLKGSTKLVQALELPYLSAWIGYYLSLFNGVDPGPEPWITKLKESLAENPREP